MKIGLIIALCAAASLPRAAAAAELKLSVETVVTEVHEHGPDKVLGRFRAIARDGEKILVAVGEQRFSVTPRLRGDGTVDLSQTLTHPMKSGGDATLGPNRQHAPLGEAARITYGSVCYATKVSLAK